MTALTAPHVTSYLDIALLAVTMWAIDRGFDRGSPTRLYLRVSGRWISGVCQGIAHFTGANVWLLRSAFVAATLLGSHAIAAYLVIQLAVSWDPEQKPLIWSNRLWARLRTRAFRTRATV